ncbi:MAG: ATP-grasp domain-containing protein [Candidatus Odinarchaeum yellowstonii]|uniref:ATP-grasp domain-containing protein n=1 Tax=Odinarchaeota yellowstonii (strain LCB_4) TaxID=1841599 RepID=A0AAF0D3N6_ODILC|nr:MAG: ATP-grasp domain-containing protein [Candidatus Odinarchaeum yellowstonii]
MLIVGKPGTFESEQIVKYLNKREVEFDFLSWCELTLPRDFRKYKIILVRTPPPLIYRDMPVLLLNFIEALERQSIKVIPSSESVRKCDKLTLYSQMKDHGIKTPPTILTSVENEIKKFIEENKVVVYKPLIGGGGRGILKIEEFDIKLLSEKLKNEGYVLIQKFVENQGYDIRTIVIGGEVVSQYARTNRGDFRYNIHLGGAAIPKKDFISNNSSAIRFFKESEIIALKVKKILGLDMCGVDTLPSIEGAVYFLEANPFFGFKGAVEKVGERIVDYLIQLEKNK